MTQCALRAFLVYFEFNRNSMDIGLLCQAVAKYCHLSLTEVTLIRKFSSFVIVNKSASQCKVMSEISVTYNVCIEVLEFWLLLLDQ